MGVIATLTSSAAHRNTSLRRGTGRVGRDTWRGTLWSPNARSKAQPGSGSLRPTEPLCASPAEPEDAGRPWQKRGSRTRSPMPCAVLPARVALPPSRDTAPPPPPHSPQWTEAPGLLLHHKGSPSGRGLAAGAPSTEDQSGGRPRRQGQGPTPGRPRRTPGMPDPGADEQAGLAQAAGARGVVAGTYLSLRRRRVRVSATWTRPRAPHRPARAPSLPHPARPRRRRRPHFGAGPRPPGPFKSGPYHRAGQGCPGRAERQCSRPWGAASPRATGEAQQRSSAPSSGRGSPPNPPQRDDPPVPSRNGRVRGARPSARRLPPSGDPRAPAPQPSGCARASGSRRRLPAARRRAQGHLPLVRSTTRPPSHPGHDPTGPHQAGTRGPDPGHSPGEGPLIRRACV